MVKLAMPKTWEDIKEDIKVLDDKVDAFGETCDGMHRMMKYWKGNFSRGFFRL